MNKMKICAAGSCKSNSELNTGLMFYPLPKDEFVRDQWIDLLGIDDSTISDQTRVCSLHFKAKDYSAFKRNIKAGSLPSLYLSKESSVPLIEVSDSGSEHGDSEEIKVETNSVKNNLDSGSPQVNAETAKEEEKPVRRASRKAALLAAEKIQRTVREYGLLEGVRSETPEPEFRRDSSISAKLNLSKELKAELLKKKVPNLAPTTSPSKNITVCNKIGYSYTSQNALYMECFEEVLSPVQAAAYRQAQQEYDKVMKYILSRRSCKNEKVRIIYTSHEGEVLNTVGPIEDSSCLIQASLVAGARKNTEHNIAKPVQLTSNLEQSAVIQPVILTGKSGTVVQNHKTTKPSTVQTTNGENSSSELIVNTTTGTAMGSLLKDTTKLQPTAVQNKPIGEIQKNVILKQHGESGNIGKSPHLHTTLIQGSSKTVSAHSLMDIKPKPLTQVSPEEIEESIDKLKNKLLEEKCFQEPAFWLVTMKMLPENPLCLVCTKSTSDLVPDSTSIDGYVWKCGYERCGKKSQIIRPNFFGRFGIPLSKLLQLTYHWAIQSDLNDTLGEVNVDVYMARSVWRALQEVCARALVLKSKKLGGPGTMVEVSFAYMGRFSILGAYDRETGKVRMKAISSSMGWSASVYIRSLEPWLLPNSVIVSSEERMKDITRSGHTFILAHVGASEEEENNVHKVRNYLYVQLSAMFGQFIVAQLKLETVQGYLDEIQWRERFGTNPYDTFSNIITDIGEQSGRKISSVGPQKQNQLPENVITMIGEKNDLKYQREYKGQVKRPAENIVQKTAAAATTTTTTTTAAVATPPPPKKPKSDEGVYVILSEYYYAKKEGDSEEIGKESKESFQFKCHFCKKILDNNIRVMKHINCHIENKRQKNPDLSDLTQCKFCFRDFETPFSMQCHIETVHMKMDASTCQICNQAFSSRFTLCAHMKSVHVECEMPYVCKVCNFRASVHQQVIEHFQQVHNGSDKFQCHYCLEVFTARISPVQKIGMTQNFFLHLQKHQLKSQSRKCPACCLVFTNSNNVKMHRTTDHVSMAEVEGVIRMKAQRNEKDVVIRDPHIKPVKMAKGRISPVRKELGSISQPLVISASEEKCLDLNITADTSHLRCIECKNDIDKEHFRKFMSCIQCGYGTHCGKAFVEHMSIHLSVSNKKKSSLNYIKPVFCQRAMFCICGYNSINGNDLVLHLVVCGKRSCYPSRAKAFMATIKQEPETIRLQPQSAFFPPLVVLDADEEESINESFARVQTLRSTPSEVEVFEELKDPASLPKTTTPITNKTGSSSEQPLHMLNVLGLVRKNPSVTGKEDKNTRNNVTILANSVSVGKECAPEEKSSRNGSESVIYLLDDSDENKTVETEAEEKTGSEIKGSLTTLIDVPSKVSQL